MASPILKSIPWTVIEPLKDRKPGQMGADAVCLRCGGRWTLPTPVAVCALPWLMRGFQEMHRYCEMKVSGVSADLPGSDASTSNPGRR